MCRYWRSQQVGYFNQISALTIMDDVQEVVAEKSQIQMLDVRFITLLAKSLSVDFVRTLTALFS